MGEKSLTYGPPRAGAGRPDISPLEEPLALPCAALNACAPPPITDANEAAT